jgi:hypothetical protein
LKLRLLSALRDIRRIDWEKDLESYALETIKSPEFLKVVGVKEKEADEVYRRLKSQRSFFEEDVVLLQLAATYRGLNEDLVKSKDPKTIYAVDETWELLNSFNAKSQSPGFGARKEASSPGENRNRVVEPEVHERK